MERKASNQIFDTLLILLSLTVGQIIRGLATRKFLSNYTAMRHRFIFGLNGFGSLVNLLIPLRFGDILRLLVLSKKKLGFAVSTFFVVVERVADLFIANTVFFALAFFRDDLRITTINFLGWILGSFGLLLFLFGVRPSRNLSFGAKIANTFEYFRLIFPRRELAVFYLSLAGSWGFTSFAFLILAKRYSGLIQQWISLNSNFSDPLSLVLSVYNLLFLTLIIPLMLAFLYSFSIPSPAKFSRITIKEFLGSEQSVVEIKPFGSKYAGSGSDLFIAETFDTKTRLFSKFMVKVDYSNGKELNPTEFMKQAPPQYRFPKVHHTKVFMNVQCTILEFLVNHGSGEPCQNAFERLSSDSDSLYILDEVIDHIIDFHSVSNKYTQKAINEALINDLKNRILRTEAFVALTLNYFDSEDRIRVARFAKLTKRIISDADRLNSRFRQGICHGDASLSNFLVQKVGSQIDIRSIDPNTRFSISNLEFDLAKVMQSTHALYEFCLVDSKSFPRNKIDFLHFQEGLGWRSRFIQNISDVNKFEDLDFELLQFFLLLHLTRIVPYKVSSGKESLRQFLDLVHWVDDLVNF